MLSALDFARAKQSQIIDAILRIETADEMRAFYRAWCEALDQARPDLSPANREAIVRANIGWCFGEGMVPERAKLWHETVGAAHPYGITPETTPEQAFQLGLRAGEALKRTKGGG